MLEQIVEPLLGWFGEHGTDSPVERTAAAISLSGFLKLCCSQTRVEAVNPFLNVLRRLCRTFDPLPECPEDKLLKLWEGLGYYNRVRNMQKAAQNMVEFYDGEMPADYEKLLGLPGIGPYTAGAVASIAFEIPVPAVDGNVLRVITRITQNDGDILKQSSNVRSRRSFWQ